MKRKLKDTVVNTADKTASVNIERSKIHPLYRKRFISSKKFLAHDEIGVAKGDMVLIEETKPISKKKKWQIIGKIDDKKEGK